MALARRHAACVAAAAARVRVQAPCTVAHRGVVPTGTCARRVRAATCEATRTCTTSAHKLAADIAVIDVAPFRHGSPAEKQHVADQVARACETIGFFGVTGHGLPDAVVRAAWDEAWAFFDRVNEGTPEGTGLLAPPLPRHDPPCLRPTSQYIIYQLPTAATHHAKLRRTR